jgi:hypothetical protein
LSIRATGCSTRRNAERRAADAGSDGSSARFSIPVPALPRPVIPWVEAVFCVGFLVVPALVPGYLTDFASRLLILALFALSFDLVFGYAGIMSFGQAFFFGGAGCAVALSSVNFCTAPAPWRIGPHTDSSGRLACVARLQTPVDV